MSQKIIEKNPSVGTFYFDFPEKTENCESFRHGYILKMTKYLYNERLVYYLSQQYFCRYGEQKSVIQQFSSLVEHSP